MKDSNALAEKSLDFSVRVVKLCKFVRQTKYDSVLTRQLTRSGTSIGANVAEAQGAQSKADFIAKLHISLKEAYETLHWIELFKRLDYLDEVGYKSIKQDAEQIRALLIAIIRSSKGKK